MRLKLASNDRCILAFKERHKELALPRTEMMDNIAYHPTMSITYSTASLIHITNHGMALISMVSERVVPRLYFTPCHNDTSSSPAA